MKKYRAWVRNSGPGNGGLFQVNWVVVQAPDVPGLEFVLDPAIGATVMKLNAFINDEYMEGMAEDIVDVVYVAAPAVFSREMFRSQGLRVTPVSQWWSGAFGAK